MLGNLGGERGFPHFNGVVWLVKSTGNHGFPMKEGGSCDSCLAKIHGLVVVMIPDLLDSTIPETIIIRGFEHC